MQIFRRHLLAGLLAPFAVAPAVASPTRARDQLFHDIEALTEAKARYLRAEAYEDMLEAAIDDDFGDDRERYEAACEAVGLPAAAAERMAAARDVRRLELAIGIDRNAIEREARAKLIASHDAHHLTRIM